VKRYLHSIEDFKIKPTGNSTVLNRINSLKKHQHFLNIRNSLFKIKSKEILIYAKRHRLFCPTSKKAVEELPFLFLRADEEIFYG
jgi:hypothetical protein